MLESSFHFPADVICMFRTTIGASKRAVAASSEDWRSENSRQLPAFGHHHALARIQMTYARSSVRPYPRQVQERSPAKDKGCTARVVTNLSTRAQDHGQIPNCGHSGLSCRARDANAEP